MHMYTLKQLGGHYLPLFFFRWFATLIAPL